MNLLVKRTNDKSILPRKAHSTDVGYDLIAIDVFKQISNEVFLLETGIAVKPPSGYYVEILPRSSIIKTGWILANSVGVIDPDFRDSLKIAVMRISDDALPVTDIFNRFQLVVRKLTSEDILEVFELDDTERGIGGFGSTDNQK